MRGLRQILGIVFIMVGIVLIPLGGSLGGDHWPRTIGIVLTVVGGLSLISTLVV